jgi:hypothetical protein
MGRNAQCDDSRDQVGCSGRMKLFSGPLSMFGAKVQIAAHEKGIEFKWMRVFHRCGCHVK